MNLDINIQMCSTLINSDTSFKEYSIFILYKDHYLFAIIVLYLIIYGKYDTFESPN